MKIRAMRVGNTRLSEPHRFQKPFSVTRRELMPVHMRSSFTSHHPQRLATRRSRRWGAILVGMVALVAAFAGTALAGVVRPPVTGTRPQVIATPPTYVGPTADITAVANAISRSHKSLEIVVTVSPGLTLTNSVTISIRFINSAGVPKVITQCYVASTGNRFVFHDIEGNGQPRRVGMQATLSQDKFRLGDAAGPSFTMPGPWYFDLDPLYDVSISPLRFKMTSKCDRVGDSEIKFMWYAPEKQYHAKSFHTRKGRLVTIGEFAWARQEMSASANLLWPTWAFIERDSSILSTSPQVWDIPKQEYKLLPGSSGYVGRSLKEASGQGGCYADIAFDMTIQVRKYANDSPGGTGCFPSAIQR